MSDLRKCPYCGKLFERRRIAQVYCSEHCQERAERARYMEKRSKACRRSYSRGITLTKVIIRGRGICHICGKPVDFTDCKRDGRWFIFGANYPTIDHVIPLSKGGTHTWNNVRLAHMHCNCAVKREIKLEEETDGHNTNA